MNKQHIILGVLLLISLAWWSRYDIHCDSESPIACVAYDRLTGNWIKPIVEARKN
jgi:hypothetical protein